MSSFDIQSRVNGGLTKQAKADIDGDDPTAEHYDDPLLYPMTVTCDTTRQEFENRFVDYGERSERDVVLSGPVLGGWGPGRYYFNRRAAFRAHVDKYGKERVMPTEKATIGRWSLLIKGLKNAP